MSKLHPNVREADIDVRVHGEEHLPPKIIHFMWIPLPAFGDVPDTGTFDAKIKMVDFSKDKK